MDNISVNVVAEGKEPLLHALSILFKVRGFSATHWIELPTVKKDGKVERYKTLVFLWHEEKGASPFVTPIDANEASEIAEKWLENVKTEDSGGYDHDWDDVSHGNGFRVFCDYWGHVGDYHYAIAGVQAHAAWYGK